MSPPRILLCLHTYGNSFIHSPRLVCDAGVPVDGVFAEGHPLLKVRGLDRRFVADQANWADLVERRILSGEYSLMLNVDEPGLQALYRHNWSPESTGHLPFPPGSALASTVESKSLFYAWCRDHGLPVPDTYVCSNFREACRMKESLPGSWLLKGDAGSGGTKVMRSPDEVDPEDLSHWANQTWLVQRDEGRVVGSGIFVAKAGRVLAWFGIRKLVCMNRGYGPTVLGAGDCSPEVGRLCAAVAEAGGLTGLTGFDFVRRENGELLLIDSHLGRMSPMQHFGKLYGVEIAAALRELLEGTVATPPAPVPGLAFVKLPEALQLVLQEGVGGLSAHLRIPVSAPVAPPGDLMLAAGLACRIVAGQVRVRLGTLRRRAFAGAREIWHLPKTDAGNNKQWK